MYDYEAIRHHIEKGNLPEDYEGDPAFSLRAIRRALAETDFAGLAPEGRDRYRHLQAAVCEPGREEDALSYM